MHQTFNVLDVIKNSRDTFGKENNIFRTIIVRGTFRVSISHFHFSYFIFVFRTGFLFDINIKIKKNLFTKFLSLLINMGCTLPYIDICTFTLCKHPRTLHNQIEKTVQNTKAALPRVDIQRPRNDLIHAGISNVIISFINIS